MAEQTETTETETTTCEQCGCPADNHAWDCEADEHDMWITLGGEA